MTSGPIDRAMLFVGVAVAGLSLLVAARMACVDGLLRRVTIDGPSMAPALLGRHLAASCADCGFPFEFDADHLPRDKRFVCPNCGFIHEPLPHDQLPHHAVRPAQAVLIDRWPLLWRLPRRFEIVACRAPDGDATVKRVAWLPGEQPRVVDGDLYDGERVLRKSPGETRLVRLLVHDDVYRPMTTASAPPRWQGDHWRQQADGYVLASPPAGDDYQWLVYQHWPAVLDATRRTERSCITDNDPYNQGETRRELNVVHDFWLTCRLKVRGPFTLTARDGQRRLEVEVRPRIQAVLRMDGQEILNQPLAPARFFGSCFVEFGLCDRQVFLILDGQSIIHHPYSRNSADIVEALEPLAIGANAKGCEVSRLRVWRDIYYLDADGLSRGWQSGVRLGPGEYALLGDNQPVSVDCRQWESCAVSRAAIWGLVYRPFWRSDQ